LYNSAQSSTYHADGRNFSICYADDGVCALGFYSQDVVLIGGMIVKNQTIAQATQFPGNVYDGVLGMAFNSASTGNAGSGDPTVFQNLISQHQLENNVFSFYLNR